MRECANAIMEECENLRMWESEKCWNVNCECENVRMWGCENYQIITLTIIWKMKIVRIMKLWNCKNMNYEAVNVWECKNVIM